MTAYGENCQIDNSNGNEQHSIELNEWMNLIELEWTFNHELICAVYYNFTYHYHI